MGLYREFTTQEEIDAQYNVEVHVPDMRPYVEWFIGDSAKARAELTCRLDQRFGPTLEETVDVFPAARPGAPVLVFIHGGYWRRLTSKEFSLVARGPLAHGFAVVVSNYSLCPKVTLDEITRQSRAAIAWIAREATTFNGDPDRIIVCGHSAGGQQVGMLAATDWPGEYGLPADLIKAGVPISALFDLRPFPYSWLQPKLQLTREIVERQSPLFHIPTRGPRLLATLGGEETSEFHRQTGDYLEAWRAAGLEGELLDQPGCNHFTAIAGLQDPGSALCRAIAALAGVR